MKSKTILTLTVLFFTSQLFGQLFEIPLKQKIREASLIVEGKVIETKSYLGDDDRIYTANKVKIYKSFKGVPSSEYLTVLTKGGEFNGMVQTWTHHLTLGLEDAGIFTLIETNRPYQSLTGFSEQAFEVYSSSQGFFKYTFEGENISAFVPFAQYKNIEEELYDVFRQEFGTPILFDSPEWGEEGFGKERCLVYKFEVSQPSPQNLLELEATVWVKSTIGQYYLYQSAIVSEYNTSVLGDSIVQNGNLQLIDAGISISSNYDVATTDLANNKLEAKVTSNTSSISSMFLLDENFSQLIKLKVTLQELTDPEILITPSAMQESSEYFNPETSKPEKFECVLVEGDFAAGCLCTEPPVIESFEPAILRAGTDDILTIRGTCFGDSSAFIADVEFTNSWVGPTDPIQWIQQHSNKVVAWSDTLIKIIVPSRAVYQGDFNIKHSAGTGYFRINKRCGPESIDTSDTQLQIRYAALNYITLDPGTTVAYATPVYLGNYNGFGGQSIAYGTFFENYLGATDAFERALISWRCATGINYVIQDDTEVDLPLAGIVELESLGAGIAAGTINTTIPGTGFAPCDSLGFEVGANRTGFIILFNQDVTWHTDTLMPALDITVPIDTADLESTALHELAHTHLLNHVNDSTDLMFYRKPFNVEYRRNITPESLAGGLYIMDISTNLAPDSCQAKMVEVTGNCEIISDIIEVHGLTRVEIKIFPNPTNGVLNVSLSSLNGTSSIDLDWMLYDLNGRKASSGTLRRFTTINLQNLNPGIYFFNLFAEGEFIKSFKVVKQ